MNIRQMSWFLVLLLSIHLGCGSSDRPATGRGQSEGPSVANSQASVQINNALHDLRKGRRSLQDLRIDLGCLTDTGFRSVKIFGNGVGIWNRERQFQLNREQIMAVVEAFQRVDFGSLEEMYGGPQKEEPEPPAVIKKPPFAIKITCRVILTVGDITKQVVQRERGRQSKELRQLANEIFNLCSGPARSGVTAATLTDGLQMVARGKIAPEALEVLVHRRPDGKSGDKGWLLRIEGRVATTRPYLSSKALGEPVRAVLSQHKLASLSQVLADSRLEDLPGNLYALHYTDLSVKVLNREKKIQARQFARMTATTHGEKQDRFNRILVLFQELHHQLMREGKELPSK